MARTEYDDDPDAPKPNSMVVAASAVVTLPGTAIREVKEEAGLDVEITGLVGTYTEPSLGYALPCRASGTGNLGRRGKMQDFYQSAALAGKGGHAAPVRVKLAQEITDAWRQPA